MKKFLTAAVLGCSLAALLIPAGALAGSPSNQFRIAYGTICSYTAGATVTLSQSCGSPSDVTVNLGKHVYLDYEGKTSPVPAPVAGDSGAAFVWWNKKGQPVAWKLEYSESVFAYERDLFPGTYVSSTGDCNSGTLTIQGLGSKGTETSFITDGGTVYENGGAADTCGTVTGAYTTSEKLVVWGAAMTTGNWYAFRINANPAGSHRNPPGDDHVVFGTVCAYDAGVSVTISQNCGSTSDITVNLDQHTWLTYEGSTTPTPAPVVGDSAAAYLRWANDFATVGELAYSEAPFTFAHGVFAGTYVSSTGNCTSGSLTLQDLGSSNQTTFGTDANTIFEFHGAASTCAAVSGGYTSGEAFIVLANEITDGSWYAVRVNAHPAVSHTGPHHNARVVVGTICAYTAGVSVTISQNCGSSSDVTVTIGKKATLVYEGATSPAPAPVIGDSAAAFLYWKKGSPHTWKLEYGENAFSFGSARFLGSYVASAGSCASGTLTIQNLGHSNTVTFNADGYTVYLLSHKASTCNTVTGDYTSGMPIRVNGNAMTDGSWYATRIDAQVTHH